MLDVVVRCTLNTWDVGRWTLGRWAFGRLTLDVRALGVQLDVEGWASGFGRWTLDV